MYQLVELAMTIGDRVAGPHVGFIDPREHGDVHALVESAQRMFDLFRSQGVSRQAIILSVSVFALTDGLSKCATPRPRLGFPPSHNRFPQPKQEYALHNNSEKSER